MEEKKGNKIVGIVSIVVAVILLSVGGYMMLDKDAKSNNQDDQQQNNQVSRKEDEKKEWVYDASYPADVKERSYTSSSGLGVVGIDTIIVPYININSEAAKTVNQEIKKLYDTLIQDYNDHYEEKTYYKDEVYYGVYTNNQIVSVLITKRVSSTAVIPNAYYAYNFDMTNGKLLTYEDIYKEAGYTSTSISAKVEPSITNSIREFLKDFKTPDVDTGDGGYYPIGTDFNTYNDDSLESYRKSVTYNTIVYYLDDSKNLNIVVSVHLPLERDYYDTLITVK